MSRNVEDLLPLPRQAQAAEGSYDTVGQYWRVEAGAATDPAVEWKLEHELAVRHGASVMLSDNTVVVGSPPEQDAAPPPRPQAYALHVGPEGFVLRGHDVEGLYWGLVTVEQLLDGGTELPCLRMTDWPAFPLRGHHDDISRKQVSTLEDFRRIIRRLSAYKINAYTPYMEDMLYLKSHPDVGEGRGRLTPDEVEAIHLEARRHKVLIMPTYSLIGHQENLLANPDYAHLGREVFQTMSSLDPDKPAVREFLTDVIRDVCELFPGPYFHAGFDETQGVTAEQFLRHANWCARQLRRYGKRMPMWVDMIYNHFGCEMIGELEDNIIPVNWAYGCTEDVPHHRELVAQGRPVWGLAGYGNWCAFLPDFGHAKSNIDAWKRVGLETDTPALFASQWGDDGYENHRDMCWNLFAYLGEATWSGAEGRRKDFERRFQLSFYGAELPELTEILEHLPGRLSRDPREYWALFRRNAFAMARWAEKNPDAIGHLDRDEQLLEQALGALEGARKRAERRAGHLNHFRVSVLRTLSVVHRLQLACRHGVEAAPGAVAAVAGELETVRDAYEEDWLRNNKRPNIEVSLAVYDRLLDSYERLQQTERAAPGARDGYYLLDLSKQFNADSLSVAGLPVGERELDGVPFLFADETQTHVALTSDEPLLHVKFAELPVEDVHLVITGERAGEEPAPGARLELLLGEETVFAEDLLTILHLCDWWAPLGDHIWAGGGMAHVESERVAYALTVGHHHGLARLSGFDVPSGTRADGLRLRAVGEGEVQLFAATLQIRGRSGAPPDPTTEHA